MPAAALLPEASGSSPSIGKPSTHFMINLIEISEVTLHSWKAGVSLGAGGYEGAAAGHWVYTGAPTGHADSWPVGFQSAAGQVQGGQGPR